MAIEIHQSSNTYLKALESSQGHVFGFFGISKLDAVELKQIIGIAQRNSHQNLGADLKVREAALEDIKRFFDVASKLDPLWEFSFSSKIPLSIPGYQDIQQLFLLLSRNKFHASQRIIVLSQEAAFSTLLQCCVNNASELAKYSSTGTRRGFLRFVRTLLRVVFAKSASPTSSNVLLYTLSSQPPTDGRDVYFGKLSDAIAKSGRVMTVYLSAGRKVQLPVTDHSCPLEAFATLGGVIVSYLNALRMGRKLKRICIGADLPLYYMHLIKYLRREEVCSGEYFYQQFLKHAYPRMLSKIAPANLIYPFENRSWEKWLVASARDAQVKNCVAYQHSSITPRHLAFHLKPGEVQGRFLPDQVVTIGEITAAWLKRSAPDLSDVVVEGVSLRRLTEQIPEPINHKVLVAISSSREEALSLMRIVYGASKFTYIPFVIRSHPTIPVEDLFASFDWPEHVELSLGRTLKDDMACASMVIYSSSTVALEGMLYGRLPIFVDIGDIPLGDPIDGDYSFKFQACNSEQVANCVKEITTADIAHINAWQEQAKALANAYMNMPDKGHIKRMIHRFIR